jgi:hypothetical protein
MILKAANWIGLRSSAKTREAVIEEKIKKAVSKNERFLSFLMPAGSAAVDIYAPEF